MGGNKLIFVALNFLIFQDVFTTELEGPISTSVHLTVASSPFYLNDTLLIEETGSLEIDGGVQILVAPTKKISVYGSLIINAPAETPVVINIDVTHVNYDVNVSNTYWGGIDMYSVDDVMLRGLLLQSVGDGSISSGRACSSHGLAINQSNSVQLRYFYQLSL